MSVADAVRAVERAFPGSVVLESKDGIPKGRISLKPRPSPAAQPSLLDDPAADRVGKVSMDHPDTAVAAAQLIVPKSGTQRLAVLLEVVRAYPDGMTDVEIQERLKFGGNTVRPRRGELVDGGWIRDSGRRREHNGYAHTVWTLTPAAVEVAKS